MRDTEYEMRDPHQNESSVNLERNTKSLSLNNKTDTHSYIANEQNKKNYDSIYHLNNELNKHSFGEAENSLSKKNRIKIKELSFWDILLLR